MPIPKEKACLSGVETKKQIYDTLCQWIIQGVLVPGERVKDHEIAKCFSVSRTPVREALQRLREQNLVKVLPGHGTYVSGLSLEELRPVYRLLGELLTIVLELCAPRLAGEGLDFLRRQNEELLRAVRQNETVEAQKASARFYRDLCRLSGNPYLLSLADQLLLLFLRGEFFFFEGKRSPRVCGEKNRAILDALAVGNALWAREEIRDLWLELEI